MSLPIITAGGLTEPTIFTFTTSATSSILTNLVANIPYIFKVSAVNTQGYTSSYISTVFSPITNPTAPSITSITRGNAAATINWTLSTSSGANSVTYTYRYYDTATPLIVYTGTAPTTSSGPQVLALTNTAQTPLINGNTYTFVIIATNDQGLTRQSTTTNVTPATNPTAPSIVSISRGNAAATVNWTLSTSSGANTLTYTYSYYETTTPLIVYTGTAPATSSGPQTLSLTNTVQTPLINGNTYVFIIIATNDQGLTSQSTTMNVTPATNPALPTITSISRGNAAATVNWTLSTSSGANSVTYTYSYYETTTPLVVYTGTASATSSGPQVLALTNTVQTPLINGRTYQFTIIATNDQGFTAISSSQQVIPATNPAAPALTSSATPGGGTITWTASTSSGANSITSYTYTYYNTTISGPTTSGTATLGAQTITLTSLAASNTYSFTMTATNDQGLTASSTTTFVPLTVGLGMSFFAGSGQNAQLDGIGTFAKFANPFSIRINSTKTALYVGDFGSTSTYPTSILYGIRKIIINTRAVTTLAPSGSSMYYYSITLDSLDNILLSTAITIYKYEMPSESVSILYDPSTTPPLSGIQPYKLGVDSLNNIYYTSGPILFKNNIQLYRAVGFINLGGGDTPIDTNNNVYIAESNNNQIYKVDTAGNATLFAGSPTAASGFVNGPATTAALFNNIGAMCLDASNNLYVVDINNTSIRKVSTSGDVTTIITDSRINSVGGITTDSSGKFYLCSYNDNVIYLIQ